MELEEFINNVADRTSGTEGDPLTRDEVEQVVRATLEAMVDTDKTPAQLLDEE